MDIQGYIQSGVIESYVLGIATDEDIAEIEQFKDLYPEVRTAIDDFSDSLQRHAFENAITPPPEIKKTLMKSLAGEFRSSGSPAMNVVVNNTRADELTPPSRYKVWRFAAAASIILLITSAAFNIYLFTRYSSASQQYQALLAERNTLQAKSDVYQTKLRDWQNSAQMMADTSVNVVKMPGVVGKEGSTAVVLWNVRTKEVFILGNTLPVPAAGKQYQLWALVDGKPVDAGVLDTACDGICKMKNIPRAQAFAITLENQGGSVSPHLDQLFVLGKV